MTAEKLLEGPRRGPASGAEASSLVVFLHGLGADGSDLIALADPLSQVLPDTAFVAPDAPFPCDMAPMGRQWFSLQRRDPEEMLEGARKAAPYINAFLDDEIARLGLSEDRLALVGFSQGTMMSLYCALRRPKNCAGIVGFSGLLIAPELLAAEVVSRPPVLLVHGTDDPVVPFPAMAAAEAGLKAAGIAVTSQARPGLPHGIDPGGLQLAAEQLESWLVPRQV
jgi:phospholipase/carboxylesterase